MVKATEVMAHVINNEADLAMETSLRYRAGSGDAFNLVHKSLSLIRDGLPLPYVLA